MPISTLKLVILFSILNFASAEKSSKNPKPYYITRICVESNGKTTIPCLGVHINPRWIFASARCKKHLKDETKVELYMGGTKMDCKNGQTRKVKKIVKGRSIIFIQPSIPFTLSPHLSTIGYIKEENIKGDNCITYCGHRIVETDSIEKEEVEKEEEEEEEEEEVEAEEEWEEEHKKEEEEEGEDKGASCGNRLKSSDFTLVSCNRKTEKAKTSKTSSKRAKQKKCELEENVIVEEPKKKKGKKECGSIVETHNPCEMKGFDASLAPVVCDKKLAGFVGADVENPYKIKYEPIGKELDKIEEIMAICCG